MLGASFVGYDYGVAGPFWFAAGCSPMIVFFALIGISYKRKIPDAHTSLEVVRIRYGRLHESYTYRLDIDVFRSHCTRGLYDPVLDKQHICLR